MDAVLLAQAGLNRLDLSLEGLVSNPLKEDVFVPAPAQGALGLETRAEIPAALTGAIKALHDIATATETRVERKILKALHGGCTLPLGVLCRILPDRSLSLRPSSVWLKTGKLRSVSGLDSITLKQRPGPKTTWLTKQLDA